MTQQQHIKGFERAAMRVAMKQQVATLLAKLSATEQLELLYEIIAEREAAVGTHVPSLADYLGAPNPPRDTRSEPAADEGDDDDVLAEDGHDDDSGGTAIDLIASLVARAPRGLTVPETCDAIATEHPGAQVSKQYVNIALKRLVARGTMRSRPNRSNRPGRKIYFARTDGGTAK